MFHEHLLIFATEVQGPAKRRYQSVRGGAQQRVWAHAAKLRQRSASGCRCRSVSLSNECHVTCPEAAKELRGEILCLSSFV